MKRAVFKLLILLMFPCLGFGQGTWYSIHGVVLDSAGAPVANHMVWLLSDSCTSSTPFTYYKDLVTNGNGIFSDSVFVPGFIQPSFTARTTDCHLQVHEIANIMPSPASTITFTICGGMSPSSCKAHFSATPDTSDPYLVYFTDRSLGNIHSWLWDFGDGTTSNLANPDHLFQGGAVYPVTLTVTNGDSLHPCSDSFMDYINTASFFTGCNADFYFYRDADNPLKYYFKSNLSPNYQYLLTWDFGDMAVSICQDPSHEYAQGGLYEACLIIYSYDSVNYCYDIQCQPVSVDTALNFPCEADFSYLCDSSQAYQVHFLDLSTPNINTWFWDFGDGTTSDQKNPVHVYPGPGAYTVCLLGKDSSLLNFCTDYICKDLYVPSFPSFNLAGQVFTGFFPGDSGTVLLYRMISGVPVLEDTTFVGDYGIYYFYQIPGGDYLLRVLPPGYRTSSGYFPTYYDNDLFWGSSEMITLDHDIYSADISLVPVTDSLPGPGSITGGIYYSANGTAGMPASGIEILLLDQNSQALTYTCSAEDGTFGFQDLPLASYKIYAEVTGKATTPAEVNLTSNNQSVSNLILLINGNWVSSLEDRLPEPFDVVGSLYPNPGREVFYLPVVMKRPVQLRMQVVSGCGRIVREEPVRLTAGSQLLPLDMGCGNPGLYTLRLITAGGGVVMKKFMLVR